jgi:hypothetical protein
VVLPFQGKKPTGEDILKDTFVFFAPAAVASPEYDIF